MRFVLALLLLPATALAVLPMPLYPDCGTGGACPSDYDPAGEWDLGSGHPADVPEARLDAAERALGSGAWVDRAWSISTGRTDVLIAIMDSGIEWSQGELLRKHYLHAAELPFPQDAAGADRGTHDFNGDGIFNIDDWAEDPRVELDYGQNAGGDAENILDPSDLIAQFSDGVDDDGNGYIDDIAGWDFFWNDNNPYDEIQQDGYSHGSKEGRWSVAEGDGAGGSIGSCPNCMLINLRSGDGFVADVNNFAAAASYATDMGAKVIQCALGALNNTSFTQQAIDYAYDHGVTIIGSAADETAWHANMPSANAHTVYVHSLRHDSPEREDATTWFAFSNCTNYGTRLDLSVAAEGCSSGATGRSAGIAGLMHSAAADAVEAGVLDRPLTGNEGYQLMTQSHDDIAFNPNDDHPERYPSREGWDRFFGYGRLNAWKLLQKVEAGDIPPEADITSPQWFEVLNLSDGGALQVSGIVDASRASSYSWTLEAAATWDPSDADYQQVATGEGTERTEGLLATIDLDDIATHADAVLEGFFSTDTNVSKGDKVHVHVVTLRLRVLDDEGRTAEMRRAINVQRDPDLKTGFPKRPAPSFEASPNLVDVDGDGIDEVVLLSSDGELWLTDGDLVPWPGFPVSFPPLDVADPESPRNHLDAPVFQSAVSDPRHSALSSPAVADLDGDGVFELVAASVDGFLAVWDTTGAMKPGWPFRIPRAPIEGINVAELNNFDEGFFSSPALGDLDGDGDLEIVLGGMDGQVYAFHDDGSFLQGWPVELRHTYTTSQGDRSNGERIISSPALGDIDADGSLDVVIGTNQKTTGTYGLSYALHSDGTIHDGWPITVFGAYTNALPFVGEGVPGSPAICDADGDGKLEIGTHTIADSGKIVRYDGEDYARLARVGSDFGRNSNTAENAASVIMVNSGAWGDLDGDSIPEYIIGAMGFEYANGLLDDGRRHDHDHLLGAWSGTPVDGKMPYLPAFPRIMEDLQFFLNPSVVDLDGDGLPEAMNASAGSVVHAFNVNGQEPVGWPKDAGGWLIASPTVGDTDGDGLLEVWAATRNGHIFAWHTTAVAAEANRQWVGFRHDSRNTGNCHTELPVYPVVEDPSCSGCEGAEASMAGAGGGLLLLLVGFRRRQ